MSASGAQFDVATSSGLLAAAANGNHDAIRELGFRGDPAAIPTLREIAEASETADIRSKSNPHVKGWEGISEKRRKWKLDLVSLESRIALARLGDNESLDIFIRGLSSKDGAEVVRSISSLGEIGNKSVTKHLIKFLHSRDPNVHALSKRAISKVGGVSISDYSRQALASIWPAVDERIYEQAKATNADPYELWLKWWDDEGKKLVP